MVSYCDNNFCNVCNLCLVLCSIMLSLFIFFGIQKYCVMVLLIDVYQLRQFIVFFVVFDNDVLILCIDGFNKYLDIICGNYIKLSFIVNFQDDIEN